MLSTQLQTLIDQVKTGQVELRCPKTGRRAVAVNLMTGNSLESYWCSKCCIDKLHTNESRADSVAPIEEFLDGLQAQLNSWKKRHIDQAMMDESISEFTRNLEEKLHDNLTAAFQGNLDHATSVLIEHFERNEISKIQAVEEEDSESASEADRALFTLVKVYQQLRTRKDIAVAVRLPLVSMDNSQRLRTEVSGVRNMARGEVFRKLAHLNSVAGGTRPIDENIETVLRFNCYTDQIEFETHRLMSVCIKASRPTVFYGFAFFDAGINPGGLCNISVGKCNNHDSIVDVFEFDAKPVSDQSTEILQKAKERLNPVLLPNPMLMVPDLYYNVSIKLNEKIGSYSQTMMRGQGVGSLSLEAVHKLESGNIITMMLGKDDDSNFSVYNGVIPAFYFRAADNESK